ncbi:hypothetical protein PRK78_005387 [Emydomyces testavorans]|uniref:Uncharacterized protein n=1 Tax=Emydomyces testavorans TaxID=2070801 RepID=A0AAF0IJG7_9EURO|nr:hypothetical protein PRK78_005387 [Emydomyces testavorans]
MTVDYPGNIGDRSRMLTSGRQKSKPTRFASPWLSSRSLSSPTPSSRSQSSGSFLNQDDVHAGPGGFSSSLPTTRNASNASPSKHSIRPQNAPALIHSPQADMELITGYRTDILDKKNKCRNKVPMLPHLKKASQDRSASLDLNLSAVENEGLGIYTNLDRDKRYGDAYVTATRLAGSTGHHRSISGNSQYSATMTMSSANKPGSQYVHPMRQTPRPYTPVNRSHQNSITGSASDTQQFPDLDDQTTSNSRERFNKPPSLNSSMEPRRSFNIQRENLTIFQSSSQTNVARTSSSFSRPLDTSSARETISPISRSSLEFPFRSKSRPSTTDPVARAAAVQAARQAFEDREAAKSRKIEQRTQKAQNKELRRREHKEQHHSSSRTPRLTDFTFRSQSESEKRGHLDGSNNGQSGYYEGNKARHASKEGTGLKLKSPKNAWLLFLTWLRTRIFKMGKKIKKMS